MSTPHSSTMAASVLPWLAGAALVVVVLLVFVWFTGPSPDVLTLVYSVL